MTDTAFVSVLQQTVIRLKNSCQMQYTCLSFAITVLCKTAYSYIHTYIKKKLLNCCAYVRI